MNTRLGRLLCICLGTGVLPYLVAGTGQAMENSRGNSTDISYQQIAQLDLGINSIWRIDSQVLDGALGVLLEGTMGQTWQTQLRTEGDRLIVELVGAVLDLDGDDTFFVQNPMAGIRSIEAVQGGDRLVEIVITGDQVLPEVELISQQNGILLNVTTAMSSELLPLASALDDGDVTEELELVVTADRTPQPLQNVPRSVTVIDREQIEAQSSLTRDLRTILGNLVPGFGPPPSESTPRSVTQSLRGRSAAILIDGIPLTSNYGLDRELRTIDPDIVERVEVLRGPTAIYGGQATGGVINIITRRPQNQVPTVTVDAGLNLSLTHPSESFGNNLGVSLAGQQNQWDYFLSLRRDDTGAIFDAAGDRIPETSGGGILEAEAYSILAKTGVDLDEDQRLQFGLTFYDGRQDTNFISDPAILRIPGVQKARALAVNSKTENTELAGDRNFTVNLDYRHQNLFGSQVQAQTYYRDYTSIVGAADFRGGFFDTIARQRAMGDKWGGRLQIDTPISSASNGANLLWGVDYVRENNEAPFEIFDPIAFDADRTFRKIGERTFVPLHTLSQLGLFAQLQWNVGDRWLLNGGLRHERVGLDVNDYQTFFGRPIEGGQLNFNATVFNLGTSYGVSDQVRLFGSIAQGFSVPAFGGVLRNPPAGFTSVEQDLALTEPVKVINYEIGIRGNWQNTAASLVGFYNTSDLGEDYTFQGGVSSLVRAPERLYGIEATIDSQVHPAWQLGGTASWTEGENDEDDNGNFLPISTFRISPLKLTTYIENQTTPNWKNRLQFLYVASRERAFAEEVDNVPIESYFVVDLLSDIKLGKGNLQIGIQNLFNNQYAPVQSQFFSGFNETLNAAASGTTFKITYSQKF